MMDLGVASPFGITTGGTLGETHTNHEYTAFAMVVGLGFALVAWQTRRAPWLTPTLAVFALLLTTLILDLARGYVDNARLLSHAPAVVGLAVMLALSIRRWGGGGLLSMPADGQWTIPSSQ